MPTAYTGRVLLIVFVMYVAICSLFPRAPFSVFLPLSNEPVSMEHNLRPGIDMVGGTSLVYEIVPPPGTPTSGLSEEVATALKRRVDPNGVLNLIWRPQGDTRLEIQLPLSTDSDAANEARQDYVAAREDLAQYVVPTRQVVRVIESMAGEERSARLDELAMGSAARREAYRVAAEAYDALEAARDGGTIVAEQAARTEYDAAVNALGDTNLTVEQVQAAIDAEPTIRAERLAQFAERNADFPERGAALDAYVAAADEYNELRNEIADTATLKRLLQGSGVLKFAILATDISPELYGEYAERLASVGPRPRAEDQYRWFQVERPEEFGRGVQIGPDGNAYALAYNTDERTLDERDGEWGLASAQRQSDERGFRAVGFTFDTAGGLLFGDLTGPNVDRPLAIILDDSIISAPQLNGRITSNGQITGGQTGFSEAEQKFLVNTLNAGALPARLSEDPISERTVGPQLGKDNLRAGFVACIAGLIIVAVFLIGYYFISGVVAMVAVLLNMVIILAGMAMLQATFTLPSVAGIILSLGMSVDANVLIFERLREEQLRGLSIRMALRNAYDRAFSAILDSNVTTGITAAILFIFGSEEVKGFGLTLLIGIFASLFTALYVTKTIFGLMVDKFGLKGLTDVPKVFPKWNKLLTPDINWMSKAPIFAGISGLIILGGCILFGVYFSQGRILDIEFAGGTTAQFTLKEPMQTGEVRDALEDVPNSGEPDDPLRDAQVVSIEPSATLADDTVYEVVVPEQDDAAVTAAIVERLGDRLSVRQPSTFVGSDAGYAQAELAQVFPIDSDAISDGSIAGLPIDPDLLAQTSGGVAVVLKDLSPMLDADELRARIVQQRLKGQYNAEGLRGGVIVETEAFPGENAAVVLLGNDRFRYDAANTEVIEAWEAQLASPAWDVVVDAVANPDELEKVTNIGAAVASEFQRDATIAIVLSILAIMGYIWVRFGDLKYSTATVVALAHDTLFCIAGIGYAHLLSSSFIGDLLLLDPFRLNLTMVAAILTVMGFSMNDTVVVFDRIRENRGKYGLLTRQVVNNSINQTLSRTLLTGGTTLVTIAVMYTFGGPGIHGFTFAMLIGIITGTYSSIAIASPILLLGKQEQPPEQPATSGLATA